MRFQGNRVTVERSLPPRPQTLPVGFSSVERRERGNQTLTPCNTISY